MRKLLLILVLSTWSCSPAAVPDRWNSEYVQIVRNHPEDPDARIAAYDRLAMQTDNAEDSCTARMAAARDCLAFRPAQAPTRLQGILDTVSCRQEHAQALFRLGERALAQEDGALALAFWARLTEQFPGSHWARRALEEMGSHHSEFAEANLDVDHWMRLAFDRAPDSALAGYVLLARARILRDSKDPQQALSPYLLLIDHYPSSPAWPSAVIETADLLSDLDHPGDEAKLLEEVLVPRDGRDIDFLATDFIQDVRLRLARLYELQGRTQEALFQLKLVVVYHDRPSRKDDALWAAARIYKSRGELESYHLALESLVETCPWSRYVERARKALDRAVPSP